MTCGTRLQWQDGYLRIESRARLVEKQDVGVVHHGPCDGEALHHSAGKSERLLELHLFDLDREIYGEEMEVRFARYLRPEQKFPDVEALRTQIARDVQQARESFSILP